MASRQRAEETMEAANRVADRRHATEARAARIAALVKEADEAKASAGWHKVMMEDLDALEERGM